MELTKLQIRKMVAAGKLLESDFPSAYEKTECEYCVSVLTEGGVRVFTKGGHPIADINAAKKIAMLPQRQGWRVEVSEYGFIRLYEYNKEAGGPK